MDAPRHKYIIGDCREMKRVPNESVHLIVTSPPYWQLKDYGVDSQIGFGQTYEDYINSLNMVWLECFRALSPVADCASISGINLLEAPIMVAIR